jgi:hypothetical protein
MPCDPGHVIPTSEEDVRRRAYARYEQRGREDGRALDDSLAAEAEVGEKFRPQTGELTRVTADAEQSRCDAKTRKAAA